MDNPAQRIAHAYRREVCRIINGLVKTLSEDRKNHRSDKVLDPNVVQFIDRVRQLIGESSVRNFAQRAGVKPSTLQAVLQGTRPIVDTLVAIARAGGVSVDWLATGEGPKSLGEVHSVHAFAESTGSDPDGGYELQLMRQCIIDIEEILAEFGKQLEPQAKASVIIDLYGLQKDEKLRTGNSLAVAKVIQLVRAA